MNITSFNKNTQKAIEEKKSNNISTKEKFLQENSLTKKKNNNFLNDYYSSEESKKINKAINMLTVSDLLGEEINKEISLDIMNIHFNNFFPGKVSTKSYGPIIAYAANTNQGISRDYNEDRVSLNINISKNQFIKCVNKEKWPKVSFFGIFDGHGGNKCADFLRDNLLKFIVENKYYPDNIIKAIKYGFNEADNIFLKLIQKDGKITDTSGSCGLILLAVENKIYIANVGDSRCIISEKNGKIRKDVTRDHKPNYPYEKERIVLNGGRTYQTQTLINPNDENDEIVNENNNININNNINNLILLGPYRVFPGSLSVSRTIGDPTAKLSILGGNPKIVISEPDIYTFNLNDEDIDFVILGCDGIYDHLTSKEVLDCAWMIIDNNKKLLNYNNKSNNNNDKNSAEKKIKIDINKTCANIVDFILKMSMARKSFDNVSCLIVAFKDLLNNEEKKNNNLDNIITDENLPKLGKNLNNLLKTDNKKKIVIDKIQIKDVEKNNNLYNKKLKIFSFEENNNIDNNNKNDDLNNYINTDELSRRFKKNNLSQDLKNKESKNTDDFLKYKHKIALSIKKLKKPKKHDLNLDNNNNDENDFIFGNSNQKINGNLSCKKNKINILTKTQFMNKPIKPLLLDNKFSFDSSKSNNNKYKNNLTLELNKYNDKIKAENILTKSPLNNRIKDFNIIHNYNSKFNNYVFNNNKFYLNNINTFNINLKTRNINSLNSLLNLDNEQKNKNIRLKTLNKKSISFSNNILDDQINPRKKSQDKNSFQYNFKENFDNYNLNPIKTRNSFSKLKETNTANLKKHININLYHNNNREEINKLFKSNNINGKNLLHNLTENLLIDNKRIDIPNMNIKNRVNINNIDNI